MNAYFQEFEKNASVDNENSLTLIREIVLISMKGVLNKDPFYRLLITQFEQEIIDNLENLKEEDFSWNFGESETTAQKISNKSKFFYLILRS